MVSPEAKRIRTLAHRMHCGRPSSQGPMVAPHRLLVETLKVHTEGIPSLSGVVRGRHWLTFSCGVWQPGAGWCQRREVTERMNSRGGGVSEVLY